MKCAECKQDAKWKVPRWGDVDPYCLCDEHVKGWVENQPHNVKAIDDNTPWVDEARGYKRSSIVPR